MKGDAKLAVFAGTSEGRALCAHLAASGVAATVCVATEYGRLVLPELPGLEVQSGRMDAAAMTDFLAGYTRVVDATHPYASAASANLRAAAAAAGVEYLRLVRPVGAPAPNVVTVADAAAAAAYLAETAGPVLLTTGSKELAAYTQIPDFAARLYARVLPLPEVLTHCLALGYAAPHLLGMQGPFSYELNLALLRGVGAAYLVTKDTGDAGGLLEKLAAAEAAGATVVLIARPLAETGYTLAELQELLTGRRAAEPAPAPGRFPLFVDLRDQPCLVVGGGKVACRRIAVLQRCGARVTAVAPRFRERLPGVTYHERCYQADDLAGMRLVVAATDARAVNHEIAAACRMASIPVSVADCPAECSFFFPALCETKHLTAGLVSRGGAHQLTARAAAAVRTLLKEMDL